MSHIISIVSMLGGQTQTRSANSSALASNALGGIPLAMPDSSGNEQTAGAAESNSSNFQLLLSALLPQSAASQNAAVSAAVGQSTAAALATDDEEASIALPFPPTDNDLPIPAENSSVSGVMPFTPFIISSALQIQESAPVSKALADSTSTIGAAGTQTQPTVKEVGNQTFRLVDTVPSMPQVRESYFAAAGTLAAQSGPIAQSAVAQQTTSQSESQAGKIVAEQMPAKEIQVPLETLAPGAETTPKEQSTVSGVRTQQIDAITPGSVTRSDATQKNFLAQMPEAPAPAEGRRIADAPERRTFVTNTESVLSSRATDVSEQIPPSVRVSGESSVKDNSETTQSRAALSALQAEAAAGDVTLDTQREPANVRADASMMSTRVASSRQTGKLDVVASNASISTDADASADERAAGIQVKSAATQSTGKSESAEFTKPIRSAGELRAQKESMQPSESLPGLVQTTEPTQKNSQSVREQTSTVTSNAFVQLHEAIAAATGSESGMIKQPQKSGEIKTPSRTKTVSSETDLPIAASVQSAKHAHIDVKEVSQIHATQTEPLRAESVPAAPIDEQQQSASALQSKQQRAGDATIAAHASASTSDARAPRFETPTQQHPAAGIATTDVQPRTVTASGHESAQPLSPRVREDVFERVFREVSSIRHTPASVDVTLSPESLGKVTVNVGMDEGKMSARINVQNADVKQILDSAMPRLQDALHASGLALDSVAVFVNNGSSFAERRNDAPKRKAGSAAAESDTGVEGLQSVSEAKQFGYSTVEYIM